MTGQLDFKCEPQNVHSDFPFLLFPPLLFTLLQIQDPGEVMPHFLFRLAVVADGGSVGRGIPQYKAPFSADHIKGDVEMDPAGPPYAPGR